MLKGSIQMNYNLFIIIFVFLCYGLLGFYDDFKKIMFHDNKGLSIKVKFVLQLLIAIAFYMIYHKFGGTSTLEISLFNFKVDLGIYYTVFILFLLVATTNAVNITDGLDGLAGGLSVMSYLAFALISFGSTWVTGHSDIAIFCFILTGALMGFLLYNTYPAKVIMGDTGSLTLGGTLAAVAIITNHELTLVIVAGVFVIETLTCIIQIIAGRYFGKKVFLMAPLHHHFEKLGWEERDIVKLFWTFGLILSMAAIGFGVWI
jgi:phospho-N-acetylmuramoyl-pentapeptide-transferase